MHDSIFQPHRYLDFHTHRMRHADRADVMEIVSVHPGKGHPHQYFTIGYHPWWIEVPIAPAQHDTLVERLADPECLALGEVGLDNLKGPTLNRQMEILRSQLPLAVVTGKPVIIHCVRAFDQLVRVKREFPDIRHWCIHGYGRHGILARQLIDQGFYLSLMPGLPDKKYQELCEAIPLNRMFLETDSMPDVSIDDIYFKMAGILTMEVTDLCRQMNVNAQNFFQR
ncbi:MAG: TatD family hydrolase [Cyclobacteriaceae bacterium]|nr:TatD family hydrolase [Cyclobacteriaceae bacterium]